MEPLDTDLVEIDGTMHEGGGQMLRNSLALSVILNKKLKYSKIRANRPNPGINKQLETVIQLIQKIDDAEVKGLKLKSFHIEFIPKAIKSGKFFGDCHTAASLTLVLQALVPILIFGKEESRLTLKGGTVVGKSPPIKYTEQIFLNLIAQMGINIELNLIKDGYYPVGGGEIQVAIKPLDKDYIRPIQIINRGKIKTIYIEVITYSECEEIVEQFLKELEDEVNKILQMKYTSDDIKNIKIETNYTTSGSFKHSKSKQHQSKHNQSNAKESSRVNQNIYGIIFLAYGQDIYLEASQVNEDDIKRDEVYVRKVLEKFKSDFMGEACVDEHTQDQLLILMALAKGKSKLRTGKELSDHTKSCFYIFEKFIKNLKFEIIPEGNSNIIEIEGIGYTVQSTKQSIGYYPFFLLKKKQSCLQVNFCYFFYRMGYYPFGVVIICI